MVYTGLDRHQFSPLCDFLEHYRLLSSLSFRGDIITILVTDEEEKWFHTFSEAGSGLCHQIIGLQILALLSIGCVISGKLLNLPIPHL